MTRDQQIFDQLDRLERGARVSHTSHNEYANDSSAGYWAYDTSVRQNEPEQHGYEPWEYDYAPELMVLNALGM